MFTYGFFNSVNGDRSYNADTFNLFFEGLISRNGVFEGVDGGFKVTASGTGLTVNIDSGKAIVNNHWVKSDAIEAVTLGAAHNILGRYDAICLRWNATNRTITITVTPGTPASTPVKPTPKQNELEEYEIIIAYVYVGPNVTTITNANIIDCRYDTSICGVVAGLIEQVDTTGLYRQYTEKFEQLILSLSTWQENQKRLYDEWFAALTGDLNVNTKLTRKVANYVTTRENGTQYIDVPASLNYENGDILEVFVNGILLVEGLEYDLMMNEVENVPMIFMYSDVDIDNNVTFYCLKSEVGA